MKNRSKPFQGISFRTLNYIMAGVTVVISLILLISTLRTLAGYETLRKTTEDFINWQIYAGDMQKGSDILTEDVRSFVETGDRAYLDDYFTESENTKNRDLALEKIGAEFKDTDTFDSLQEAMNESVSLMNTEYKAMRLKIESMGGDPGEYPEKITEADVSEYSSLSNEEKAETARRLVFDENYHKSKNFISKYTNMCLSSLINETKARQETASGELHVLLRNEQIFIMALIAIVLILVALTSFQVIHPLISAIPNIRDDQPIPVKGAPEFRFLAETYNQMYETNLEKKKQLAFAASHDPLTKILNRSGFDKLMKTLNFKNVALLLIDIDNFKSTNDENGHEIGDRILIKVVDTIKDNFRGDDYLCRIGGDEFAMFMQHTGEENKKLIESKINHINDILESPEDDLPPTSISVGAAFGTERHAGEIFNNADKALYVTKENGRKGISFYDR